MKIERFSVRACCGNSSVALKLGKPLSAAILASLVSKGYQESKHFTKVKILYVENDGIIATGAFNSNILQIRCKKKDCASFINAIEELLAAQE